MKKAVILFDDPCACPYRGHALDTGFCGWVCYNDDHKFYDSKMDLRYACNTKDCPLEDVDD